MQWSDLRIFHAVMKAGSLRSAAESLGVNHATVSRRISALEHALGVRLLERVGVRYELTQSGSKLLAVTEEVSSLLNDIEHEITGKDRKLEGQIRLTLSDIFARTVGDFVKIFQQRYPAVSVDVHVGADTLNLSQREADIAFRVTSSPSETLVGRKITTLGFCAYHVQQIETDYRAALTDQSWLGFSANVSRQRSSLEWIDANIPAHRIVARVSDPGAMIALTQAGVGIGLLPCFIGDNLPNLRRLEGMSVQSSGDIWLLMHRELRGSARHTSFLREFGDYLVNMKQILSGDSD